MTLWRPYKDDTRALSGTELPISLLFHAFHHSPNTPVEHHLNYHHTYTGYDPIPILGPDLRTSLSPHSACSSGTSEPKLKVSRPFKQMTSKDGTTMSNIREYYARVLPATKHNPRMKRDFDGRSKDNDADEDYLAKRRKNNEAAKRSREVRKTKEDELAVYLAYLEGENHRLNQELKVTIEQLEMYQ